MITNTSRILALNVSDVPQVRLQRRNKTNHPCLRNKSCSYIYRHSSTDTVVQKSHGGQQLRDEESPIGLKFQMNGALRAYHRRKKQPGMTGKYVRIYVQMMSHFPVKLTSPRATLLRSFQTMIKGQGKAKGLHTINVARYIIDICR